MDKGQARGAEIKRERKKWKRSGVEVGTAVRFNWFDVVR